MGRFAVLFALLACALVSANELFFDEGDAKTTVLASFGDAVASVSVLYWGPEVAAEDVTVEGDLVTAGLPEVAATSEKFINYTIPLSFDKGVGPGEYTITIGPTSVKGNVCVAGFVILDDGKIVSGEGAEGVSVGQTGSTTYDVKAYDGECKPVDISATKISATEAEGTYFKELDQDKTSIDAESFVLAIADYRVGTGSFIVQFETDAIEYRGESFETVLNVKQSTDPEPPCVAIGGDITTKDGYVLVPMYNLRSPPLSSPVREVVISIDGESATWDTDKSDLSVPDQIAAFKISAAGTASITCDGKDAKIIGGDISVSGDGVVELAKDTLVSELDAPDSFAVFSAVLRVIPADPDTFTRAQGQALLDLFGTTVGSSRYALTSVTRGSAVCSVQAAIEEDTGEEAEAALARALEKPECEFQTKLGYECDDIVVSDMVVKAVAGLNGAATAGLATWTIVLIACVGAFALILVVVLGLWAVYRRSAEQSESDYSSSGPLGVPDPSDLLYEQSIVRDIYGRGDFPDGGPSQAVAEQRAREADLREEYPRPPSSSGLSRGAGTDDASSTYSV